MGLYKGGGGGGLISGIIYSFENGWAYIWGNLKLGGLKSGILRYFSNNHLLEIKIHCEFPSQQRKYLEVCNWFHR